MSRPTKWRWTRLSAACLAASFYTLQALAASAGRDIVVMLDMSMEDVGYGSPINILSGGARAAAAELNASDRAALLSFSGNAKTLLPLTSDASAFESALHKTGNLVVQRRQRHLYDSLLTALDVFPTAAEPGRRRCILVLTTASDAGSRHNQDDVIQAAKAKTASIYIALLAPQPLPIHVIRGKVAPPKLPNFDEEKKALEPLALRTLGDVRIYEANPYAPAKAIQDIANPFKPPLIDTPGAAAAAKHDTLLLNLDVQVIDSRTGDIPELLGPRDFEVYADGQKIPIRNVGIETPPLDLIFVIYLSNHGLSSRLDRQRYARGVDAAVKSLRPDDRVGVIRGAGTDGITLPLSEDQAAIKTALLGGRQRNRYRLFDAASIALSLLSEQPSPDGRPAIVAITDDVERQSETKEDSLQAALVRAGVTLHEVMIAVVPMAQRSQGRIGPVDLPEISVGTTSDPTGPASLTNLARATGGETLIGADFDTALPALLPRLRMRYLLTVEAPAALAGFHKIEVKLSPQTLSANPAATVRTRTGYYSEP